MADTLNLTATVSGASQAYLSGVIIEKNLVAHIEGDSNLTALLQIYTLPNSNFEQIFLTTDRLKNNWDYHYVDGKKVSNLGRPLYK